MRIFRVIPFNKLQNDTKTTLKRWKMRCRTRTLTCFGMRSFLFVFSGGWGSVFLFVYLSVFAFNYYRMKWHNAVDRATKTPERTKCSPAPAPEVANPDCSLLAATRSQRESLKRVRCGATKEQNSLCESRSCGRYSLIQQLQCSSDVDCNGISLPTGEARNLFIYNTGKKSQ